MKNKFTYGFGFLFIALLVLQSCGGKEEVKKEEVFLPLVKIQKAEIKTFEHKIAVQGNVETDQDVMLNAEVGGLVTRVLVKEGQHVSAGQVLVSLDASVLASNANEIKTQLTYAEYMLGKQEELRKRGVGTEFDYESAKSQVNSLKSRLGSLNTQQGKSSIRAPFSGVIDQVYARDGQVVGPQNPLIRIVNNSEINVVADISEKHFSAIQVGTTIEVSFPNYKDTVVNLVVNNVGQYIEPINRTFSIKASLKNNKDFLPNMLAELNITDLEVPNALVIASKSIMKDQDNNDFVYVATPKAKNNYSLSKVVVEVIQKYKGEAYIKVISGQLKEGSLVITDGAKGITDQDIVRIK
ncbi:MAG: efflux RND transporter periplasmic adaptor subunit [Crocinitomicaceae bacterium]